MSEPVTFGPHRYELLRAECLLRRLDAEKFGPPPAAAATAAADGAPPGGRGGGGVGRGAFRHELSWARSWNAAQSMGSAPVGSYK